MAGIETSFMRSFGAAFNPTATMPSVRLRNSHMIFTRNFHVLPRSSCLNPIPMRFVKDQPFLGCLSNMNTNMMPNSAYTALLYNKSESTRLFSTGSLHKSGFANNSLHSRGSLFSFCMTDKLTNRTYASFTGKTDGPRGPDIPPADTLGESAVKSSDISGNEWVSSLKHAYQSVVDAVVYTGKKSKEVSDEFTPYVQQFFEAHPYMKDVIVPVGGTVVGTALAWLVMPKVLRRLHKYTVQGPVALFGNMPPEKVSYEKSMWSALEDPARYLITFMAFSQLALIIAPTSVASGFISQAWSGAVVLSFIWFLHRWKTNVFSHSLSNRSIASPDRERLLAFDKISSVGLVVLGLMGFAEACGVAVQSILTVGGIGGVATAFAGRDILGNFLSGLSLQFAKPFSTGETIKAGTIEGQVIEIGLTTTSLLNSEKFPVIVPNSLFSSQVIVNKSRLNGVPQ
ncbi:hypothetical protein QJS10_CPA01g02386 [Acorus calamus]|uniref:Mechanosensitive ion channel MscS domain-containing protein n=1 Tax=Acorus calamus TaxID=4465 RepID=A0AAV9FLF9_ACOCL|nr:hypothetical protein QJS10_CPA01g02386 [Acorus calamus]